MDTYERKEMIGRSVKLDGKVYEITKLNHYRLEWYEVELRDIGGNYHYHYMKKKEVQLIN